MPSAVLAVGVPGWRRRPRGSEDLDAGRVRRLGIGGFFTPVSIFINADTQQGHAERVIEGVVLDRAECAAPRTTKAEAINGLLCSANVDVAGSGLSNKEEYNERIIPYMKYVESFVRGSLTCLGLECTVSMTIAPDLSAQFNVNIK